MSGHKKTVSSYWSEQTPVGEDWRKEWKFRITPAAHSKVSGGWTSKGKKRNAVESGEQYTKRRVAEELSKRTWMTDAADIAHGVKEGILALHPYTAIPYYGAKVGQDVLNGNVSWSTALNLSVPLLHMSPSISNFNKPFIIKNKAKASDLVNNDKYVTDDIIEGAKEGFKDSYKYYSSEEYLKHLKSTGLSETEARELQEFKINNLLDTRINFDHIDPSAYGENSTIAETGQSATSLNPRVANTKDLARETVWHESGGHSSSKNYKLSLQPKIDRTIDARNIYSNPWYRRISEHNRTLIPELKPVWKAFINGDMSTFNRLATKEDLEILNKYKDPKAFIEYLEDEQESAARAISANISDFVGKKSQWNLPQLERFFTSKGIKNLRDNVWTVGTGLGGILFTNVDYNPEYKGGGKITINNTDI